MASNKYQTVVQGEASETDSDEEAYITSLSSSYPVAAGVKVLGEASETDSEDEAGGATRPIEVRAATEDVQKDLPPLIVIRNPPDSPVSAAEEKPVLRLRQGGRYSTLLQQKLQESNARLCGDVTQTVRQVYQNATKEIRLATAHLNNSQNGIINASHSIRLVLEDLKSVSEKIDIITSCNLLPDIRISTPQLGLKEC
ncbi:biogenesis of lysosome-related organelles complex 1 subunit 3 [Lepisosteus oculatus]|nr:PREDICTED: biogenesis of lysosome-related organelles complex 1 subunit 3 [Lepisosteus oculatus]